MKVVRIVVLTAIVGALAAFEFFHEHCDEPDIGALMCTAPASQRAQFTDMLLMHMREHR